MADKEEKGDPTVEEFVGRQEKAQRRRNQDCDRGAIRSDDGSRIMPKKKPSARVCIPVGQKNSWKRRNSVYL